VTPPWGFPGVKAVLPEKAVGVERLRLSEEDAQVRARRKLWSFQEALGPPRKWKNGYRHTFFDEPTNEELGRILQNNVRGVGRLAELHRAAFSQFGGLATLVAGLQAQVAALEQVLVDVAASVTALTMKLEALQQADLQQAD